MPLKIHLFPASHVCLHKTLSRRRDARAGGPQGIFLCRNIHLTDFRRGRKACGDLLSGSRGERDEEHDKELTERLECQESLPRTFLGKERCGDARQASTIEGNNSFWISHTIYHGSRPIVPMRADASTGIQTSRKVRAPLAFRYCFERGAPTFQGLCITSARF